MLSGWGAIAQLSVLVFGAWALWRIIHLFQGDADAYGEEDNDSDAPGAGGASKRGRTRGKRVGRKGADGGRAGGGASKKRWKAIPSDITEAMTADETGNMHENSVKGTARDDEPPVGHADAEEPSSVDELRRIRDALEVELKGLSERSRVI